ncbi:Aste57867_14334 [Aphanomyces stellatus]|uniref:Aste57867_14334 protein n=1 Tax=Aphanomyces stellatus TaxID=120398 RepID=A0A485L182_9STRA|nr:hypothetical protein As57867_014280 [Aphanomyces stellatus]VFT91158.1 Aste57867_14334 [Aphanomyces stellatus]
MTTSSPSRSCWHPARLLAHLAWIPQYNVAQDLKFDVIAGVTVAMMIIPQEVSLANIMHVPAQYGLYTAAVTPLLYALCGSSRVLSVANGSEVSLMIGAALASIKSEKERIAVGIFLSFYVGVLNLVLGVCRLGVVADFFSRPVMGGFLSGGGILIMLSQFPSWFQLTLDTHASFPLQTIVEICKHMDQANWNSFAVGAISIAFLVLLKHAKHNWLPAPKLADLFDPPTAIAVVVSPPDLHTTETWGFSLNEQEFTSMEHTPQSFPPKLPHKKPNHWHHIWLFMLRTACDLGPLFVCLFGGLVGHYLGDKHIKVTGHVPKGLPSPVLPWYGYTQDVIESVSFADVSINAASIALVVYMTSIAMAKRLAVRDHYTVDPNQELIGLGLASAVGAIFQVMPPTGGMSRTAVNMQTARTQLASVITVSLVMILLVVGTDALYFLPKASLAAIIIVAGFWLIEIDEATWLYRAKRDEFYVWVGSFVLTIALGILPGLIASILCSLVAILVKTKRPLVYVVGPSYVAVPPTSTTDDMLDDDGVLVVRVEGSLYFGNSEFVSLFIVGQTLRHGDRLKGIVLDGALIHDVDATTIQLMETMLETLAHHNIRFALANAQPMLADILHGSGLCDGFFVPAIADTVERTVAEMKRSIAHQDRV